MVAPAVKVVGKGASHVRVTSSSAVRFVKDKEQHLSDENHPYARIEVGQGNNAWLLRRSHAFPLQDFLLQPLRCCLSLNHPSHTRPPSILEGSASHQQHCSV